jgi:hypothetical protein
MAAPDLADLIQIKHRPLIARKRKLGDCTPFAGASGKGGFSTTKYVLVPAAVSYIMLKDHNK